MTTEDLMKLADVYARLNAQTTAPGAGDARQALLDALEALGREVEQWKVDFNEVLIERDQACAELEAIRAQEPLFYYRPTCNGEMYEGPHHAKSIGGRMLREEKPTEWIGLYASPAAKDAGLVADAARYRWLRERYTAVNFDWEESGQQAVIFTADEFPIASASCDETIDAAMGITGEPK